MPKVIKKPKSIDPFSINPDSLFFSDLHLADRKEFQRVDPVTGLNSRLIEGLNILGQIDDIIRECKSILKIYFLGDVFELKDKVPNHVLIKFKEWIYRETHKSVTMKFLMGNHDFNLPDYPILDVLSETPRFEFIKDPYVDKILGMGFIPFCRKWEDFEKNWNWIHEFKEIKIVCFHQEIPGVEYETGKHVSGEFDFKMDPKILYLSGHLHKPQKVHGVQFLGAPYETKFNAENEQRFIWLYNSKTKQLAPLALRYSKFINLDFYGSKDSMRDIKEIVNGNYTQITGEVYKEDLTMKDKKELRKNLEYNGAKAVIFATKYIQQIQTDVTEEAKDDGSVIRQYAEKNKGHLDLDRLIKTGIDAYENVEG